MIGNSIMHNKHWLPFQTTCYLCSRKAATVWLTNVERREGGFPSCLQITKFIWLGGKSSGCGRNLGNKGLVLTLPHILYVTGSISFNLPFALLSCATILQCREVIEKKIHQQLWGTRLLWSDKYHSEGNSSKYLLRTALHRAIAPSIQGAWSIPSMLLILLQYPWEATHYKSHFTDGRTDFSPSPRVVQWQSWELNH